CFDDFLARRRERLKQPNKRLQFLSHTGECFTHVHVTEQTGYVVTDTIEQRFDCFPRLLKWLRDIIEHRREKLEHLRQIHQTLCYHADDLSDNRCNCDQCGYQQRCQHLDDRCQILCQSGNDYYDSVERSEEHTSELQSRFDIVCRLLLEKKQRWK